MGNPETKDPSTETGINYEALREFFEEYNEFLRTEDLTRQAGEFERQFQDLANLTPVEVLEKLGFQKVNFIKKLYNEDLDPKLLEAIKKKRDWFGSPLALYGGIKRDIIIMQNPSKSVFYFLCRNGGPGLYECSCLRKSKKGEFEIHEISSSSSIEEVIGNVGLIEFMGPQGPDIGMPLIPPKITVNKPKKAPEIAEETREQIEEL